MSLYGIIMNEQILDNKMTDKKYRNWMMQNG
jgi:hypothetical protein